MSSTVADTTTSTRPSGAIGAATAAAEDTAPAAPAARRPFGLVFWLATGWLALIGGAAVLADVLPLRDPSDNDFDHLRSGFSALHWLGTDNSGRDLLARSIFGARISLLVGVSALAAGLLAGGLLGMLGGYVRGRVDAVLEYVLNLVLSFPSLVLALLLVSMLGAGVRTVILALAIVAGPDIARVTRAGTIAASGREFVLAARGMGSTNHRIITRELLPNVAPVVLAYAMSRVASLIVAEGALSYLGVGVPPGTPSWGSMIVAGQSFLQQSPHVSLVPAAFLCLTILSLNLVGDILRNRFDVRPSKL